MTQAHAADEAGGEASLSPFSLRVGVYDMNMTTEVRVDGLGGNLGTRLDFEDDLGLDDNKDTLNIGFRWRFKERHFLEAEYFRLRRNGFRRLEGEIRFGDEVFPIGADVRSTFTTEVTRLSYSYRIVRKSDWGMAVSAGLHVTRLRAALTEIALNDLDVPIEDTEIASVTAPLPVFGVAGGRRLTDKLALVARAQLFSLRIDDVDGTIQHGALYFEHNTFDRLGFGIGYDWFIVDVEAEDTFWDGDANVKFHGPMLFLKGYF